MAGSVSGIIFRNQMPLCNESFRDKRGLTSHARNKHDLERDEVFEKMIQSEQEKKEWKIFGASELFLLQKYQLANLDNRQGFNFIILIRIIIFF